MRSAGLIVGAIVDRIGTAKLRDALWSVTPDNWHSACERVGDSNRRPGRASSLASTLPALRAPQDEETA